jgi:flotillin
VLDSFSINDVQDSDGQYFSDLAAKERSGTGRHRRTVARGGASRGRTEPHCQRQAIIEQQRELDIEREQARQATDRAGRRGRCRTPPRRG